MAVAAGEVEALRQRLLYDTPFWAKNCAVIRAEDKQAVRLVPRPWQLTFDQTLEKQRAAGKPMRAIILKARKLGFCGSPDTRVLTADLRWVTLDNLEVGTELVGVDESAPGGRGKARKFRRSVAEAKRDVYEPAFRLTMDDGRELVLTAPHRMLTRARGGSEAIWRAVADMRVGDVIRHVCEPWEDGNRDDGWMGGMIDGEGCLRAKGTGGTELTISQRPGAVLKRAEGYLAGRGYSFHSSLENGASRDGRELGGVHVYRVDQLLRLVGQTRPTRFTDSGWWEDRDLPGKRIGAGYATIVSIEPLGVQRMIDLQTSTKTFIAEGFVSHNSTWVEAKFMQRITQMDAQYAVVVGQDRPTAGVLFDMAKLIYDRLPSDPMLADLIYGEGTLKAAPFSIRPQWIGGGETRGGSKWMSLGQKLRSSDASIYETRSAGSSGAARGYTPSLIHASEVAHWDDPSFKVGLMESLPGLPETIAVFESTANGFNDFHTMWTRAVEGAEDPELGGYYAPLFFGWQDNPAYSRQFISTEARARFERTIGDRDGGGDEEELELVEAFGVSPEQLFWRRTKLDEPQMNGDLDIFHQEYPATPEQAFIGSGRPVFPGILVARAIREAQDAKAPVEGVLRGVDWRERRTRNGTVRVPGRVLWIPGHAIEQADRSLWGAERLLVWEHPLNEVTQAGLPSERRKPDSQHVLFADLAVGAGGTAVDGDWHAVQVLDHITRLQVARYRSRVPVHEMPLLLYMIGLYFNTAWMAPEVNGPGGAVIDVLKADLSYPLIYRRHRAGDDQRQDAREFLLGWLTTQPSKRLMEQTFGAALKEGWHGLRDVVTAREFSTYVQDPKNPEKHGAQKGAHDDCAISYMGVHRVAAELQPRREGKRGRRGRWQPLDEVTGW